MGLINFGLFTTRYFLKLSMTACLCLTSYSSLIVTLMQMYFRLENSPYSFFGSGISGLSFSKPLKSLSVSGPLKLNHSKVSSLELIKSTTSAGFYNNNTLFKIIRQIHNHKWQFDTYHTL